jgi:hypothetical protein
MEGEELRKGKERVRVRLLDRLELIGMKRAKGMTIVKTEAMFERLECFLAYMPCEMLDALAEVVERNAVGTLRNQWPEELTVTNWARLLMPAPPSESRLVRTYVQSVGDRALVEGHLTELYLYLKKFGKPPTDDGWRLIRTRANENEERAARARERGGEFELNWLDGYIRNEARALEVLHIRKPREATT